jgi:hypothetical protein
MSRGSSRLLLRMVRRAGAVAVFTALAVAMEMKPAEAQTIRAEGVAFSVSWRAYRNAEIDRNCPTGSGPSIGASLRTAGTLFIGTQLQVHAIGPFECAGVAVVVPYGDGFADRVAGMELRVAPSIALYAGTQGSLGDRTVSGAVGGRLAWANWEPRDKSRIWAPWIGALFSIDQALGPFGAGGEIGMIRAPIALLVGDEAVVRTGSWKPFWQLAVRVRPWRSHAAEDP